MGNHLNLIVKGFIIGLGKILPGVSGGMLAISMGLYEKIIYSIGYLFCDFKRNFMFLFTLGMGAVVAIFCASNVISFFLNRFYVPTMFLFIGLIMGGIPGIFYRVDRWDKNHYFFMIMMIFLVMFFTFFSGHKEDLSFDGSVLSFFALIGIGFIDAATMVIPGISGTAIMMAIGFYPTFLSCMSTLFYLDMLSYNLTILIPFGIGVVVGVFLISRAIGYCFNHYKTITYAAIIGFAVASIICLFFQTFAVTVDGSYVLGVLLLIIGFYVGKTFDK